MISFVRLRRRWVDAMLSITVAVLAGCGPDERPRGTGASGTISTAAPKEEISAELVNRLDAAQQKRFDWLHQPFEKVVRLGPAKVSPERAKLLREKWDAIPFADVKSNKRYRYSAILTTSLGPATIGLADDYCPNHVRAFIVLAGVHFFDGKNFRLKDGLATAGGEPSEAEFTLEEEHYPGFHPNPGAVGNFIIDGRTAANRLAVIVQDLPTEAGQSFNHFGGFADRTAAKSITDLREKLKKEDGSVKIERVQISRQEGPLFVGEDVLLPRLSESGKPSPEKDREAASQPPSPPRP